jgi:hypothetical protein
MSINLGFYDFFSYLIPGLLYLYTFNEFLRSIGQGFIKIESWFQAGQAPAWYMFIPILIGAYLVGHLLDPVAQRLFKILIHIRNPKKAYAKALDNLKTQHPNLNIEFEPKDWALLFSFIRHRNLEMAHILDKFNADAIMLVNISLGMFALLLIQLGIFFSTNSLVHLINSGGIFILLSLAMFKCNQFRSWFFGGIFLAALEYGKNTKEVTEYKAGKVEGNHSQSNTRKAKTKAKQ